MTKIEITIGNIIIVVDCLETPTAKAIIKALPFESIAQIWGKEVYFSTPINVDKETDAKDVVNSGEISFWVEGSCIAIGYGPTPISEGDEIRLAAKTNIWSHSQDDLNILSNVNQGDPIRLNRLE